jgi:hypothetical protein
MVTASVPVVSCITFGGRGIQQSNRNDKSCASTHIERRYKLAGPNRGLAACCGMGGRLSVNKTTSIPASKLAGPTAAASCSQSTGASGSISRIILPIKVAHWGLRLDFL